jgi:hypothetical protein
VNGLPELEPPAREHVQYAHLLDQPHRVVKRQQCHQGPEADPACPLGRGGKEQVRRRDEIERRAVMLGEHVPVKAEAVADLHQSQSLLEHLGRRDAGRVDVVGYAKLQLTVPPSVSRRTLRDRARQRSA